MYRFRGPWLCLTFSLFVELHESLYPFMLQITNIEIQSTFLPSSSYSPPPHWFPALFMLRLFSFLFFVNCCRRRPRRAVLLSSPHCKCLFWVFLSNRYFKLINVHLFSSDLYRHCKAVKYRQPLNKKRRKVKQQKYQKVLPFANNLWAGVA